MSWEQSTSDSNTFSLISAMKKRKMLWIKRLIWPYQWTKVFSFLFSVWWNDDQIHRRKKVYPWFLLYQWDKENYSEVYFWLQQICNFLFYIRTNTWISSKPKDQRKSSFRKTSPSLKKRTYKQRCIMPIYLLTTTKTMMAFGTKSLRKNLMDIRRPNPWTESESTSFIDD